MIDSTLQALVEVLKIRFRDSGYEKIDRGEYRLNEQVSKRMIDLSQPWDQCFLPGQKVAMSMIFHVPRSNTCPGCKTEYDGAADIEIDWWVISSLLNNTTDPELRSPACGMTFQRITDAEETTQRQDYHHDNPGDMDYEMDISGLRRPMRVGNSTSNEITRFRRVHIISTEQLTTWVSNPDREVVRTLEVCRVRCSRTIFVFPMSSDTRASPADAAYFPGRTST